MSTRVTFTPTRCNMVASAAAAAIISMAAFGLAQQAVERVDIGGDTDAPAVCQA